MVLNGGILDFDCKTVLETTSIFFLAFANTIACSPLNLAI